MRSVAVKWCVVVLVVFSILGCASAPSSQDIPADIDPFEDFNRAIFKFNDGLDWLILKPVAKGYRYVAPEFFEDGISNFFDNLLEVPSLINSGLQGKGGKALIHTGRFLVNSTIGLLGFIDVAQNLGLKKLDEEDFGQTLGVWGLGSGPYLVLPFLGPSTVRDGLSIPVDYYTQPVNYIDHDQTRNTLRLTNLVSTRAELLDAEKLISGDKYIFIRDSYLQRRQFLIKDGEVEDTFGDSLDGGDF